MSHLPPDHYTAVAAWPYEGADAPTVAARVGRTLTALSAVSPFPAVWHVTGETTPLSLEPESLEAVVAAAAWRADPHGDHPDLVDPARGHTLSFSAWRTDVPAGEWKRALAFEGTVGRATGDSVHPGMPAAAIWPNSLSVEVAGPVPSAEGRTAAGTALRLLVREWPAVWGAMRSRAVRKALPARYQPDTFLGYSTWIADGFAPVPPSVPGASVTPLDGGTWIELAIPLDAEPDPGVVAAADAALRAAGSLPPVPAFRG